MRDGRARDGAGMGTTVHVRAPQPVFACYSIHHQQVGFCYLCYYQFWQQSPLEPFVGRSLQTFSCSTCSVFRSRQKYTRIFEVGEQLLHT